MPKTPVRLPAYTSLCSAGQPNTSGETAGDVPGTTGAGAECETPWATAGTIWLLCIHTDEASLHTSYQAHRRQALISLIALIVWKI